MLGANLGDMVGSMYEFHPCKTKNFKRNGQQNSSQSLNFNCTNTSTELWSYNIDHFFMYIILL